MVRPSVGPAVGRSVTKFVRPSLLLGFRSPLAVNPALFVYTAQKVLVNSRDPNCISNPKRNHSPSKTHLIHSAKLLSRKKVYRQYAVVIIELSCLVFI